MIQEAMPNYNRSIMPVKSNNVISAANSGKDIKDDVKKKFEETNPDMYKAMQETQREMRELQMEQSRIQREQMLAQLKMQIQKTEEEMRLATMEHQKSMFSMIFAAFNKMREMDAQTWQNVHTALMKAGEGWIKALS